FSLLNASTRSLVSLIRCAAASTSGVKFGVSVIWVLLGWFPLSVQLFGGTVAASRTAQVVRAGVLTNAQAESRMPPERDGRARRSSSIQQEAVAPENPRDQHGLRPGGRGGTGCAQTSPTTADRRRRTASMLRRSTCTTTRCLCRCSNGSNATA